jgi:hypothetical protein
MKKVLLGVLCLTTTIAFAQPTLPPGMPPMPGAGGAPSAGASKPGPKPYKEVITGKGVVDDGLIKVHKQDDKYFFEIADSVMNKEILVVARLVKSSADMRIGGFLGYGGDQINSNVIRFEKGPNNKVFLRTISYQEYAKDSSSEMFKAVSNSNIQPIAQSFNVAANGLDSITKVRSTVIDVTDYISGDNDVFFFGSGTKSALRVGSLQSDKSYVVGVKSFPINTEIRTVKTYTRASALGGGGNPFAPPSGGAYTMELNTSMVILPAKPMQPRIFDPRVGYFSVGYTDFDADPQGVKRTSMIKRWRLEPKPEDEEKYKRGELVEPIKPIVFYIDPATPKKWIPFLKQGVDDWKTAFEKAGFKNAIMAKEAPTKAQDSTWSLEDARNSAIVYKASDVPNASGPSISDPRTGEIMESHINWYHNVMNLLRNWYMIQASPNDPKARKLQFDDELMGQLIRFVSSHEVGHTLGLRHNFGSSSTVPTEKLRDKAWVEANGHTPSIMDYARFNYVAQPEDNISQKGIFPRIGDYDNWAIEWGYRRFLDLKTPQAEKEKINQWTIENLKNKRLWFGTETNPDDPRSQSEDVGDDAMKSSMYGIKNLQRINQNLAAWTKMPNEDFSGMEDIYDEIVGQFGRYVGHVSKWVGGIMETPKMQEEAGPIYEPVTLAKQKEAVDFLQKQLFTTPLWLRNQEVTNKAGKNFVTTVGGLQDRALNRLFSMSTLMKLANMNEVYNVKSYDIVTFMADMKKGIWSELVSKKPVDIYRRNLQKSYVNSLVNLINSSGASTINLPGFGNVTIGGNDKNDVVSLAKAHLMQLRTEARAATVIPDVLTKAHYMDIVQRIDDAMTKK